MASIKTYNDVLLDDYDEVAITYGGESPQNVIYKFFDRGDVLSAAELKKYIMNQTVMTFASTSERDAQLSGNLIRGMVAFIRDVNYPMYYTGSNWSRLGLERDVVTNDPRSSFLYLYLG